MDRTVEATLPVDVEGAKALDSPARRAAAGLMDDDIDAETRGATGNDMSDRLTSRHAGR